eukprot:COSAG01_NODE_26843_length_701_cov_2.905316_1_plen_212_part_00
MAPVGVLQPQPDSMGSLRGTGELEITGEACTKQCDTCGRYAPISTDHAGRCRACHLDHCLSIRKAVECDQEAQRIFAHITEASGSSLPPYADALFDPPERLATPIDGGDDTDDEEDTKPHSLPAPDTKDLRGLDEYHAEAMCIKRLWEARQGTAESMIDTSVVLTGLKADTRLNGIAGTVLSFNANTGRFLVRVAAASPASGSRPGTRPPR